MFLTLVFVCCVCFYVGRVDAKRGMVLKSVVNSESGSVLFHYKWEEGNTSPVIIDCAAGGYYQIPWEPPGFRFWILELPTWNTCRISKNVWHWPHIEFDPSLDTNNFLNGDDEDSE